MSLFKNLLFSSTAVLPARLVEAVASMDLLLPYQHVVSDRYLPHVRGLYNYKNRGQFIKDLDWLLKHRRPLHPDELPGILNANTPLPRKAFLLTFDDGFKEIDEVIAPILLKKGVPAIFFINPAFIDNRELFYRCKLSLVLEKIKKEKNASVLHKISSLLKLASAEPEKIKSAVLNINYPLRNKADELGQCLEISFSEFLEREKPFLTTKQLAELVNKGFTIGAHSMDHPHYKTLDETEQVEQTLASINYVKEITGSSSAYFSFPHEDKPVKQSFFNHILSHPTASETIFFGVQNQLKEKDNRVLHRFNAENPGHSLAVVVKSVLLYHCIMKTANRNVVVRN